MCCKTNTLPMYLLSFANSAVTTKKKFIEGNYLFTGVVHTCHSIICIPSLGVKAQSDTRHSSKKIFVPLIRFSWRIPEGFHPLKALI